jgi:hypothetical protein
LPSAACLGCGCGSLSTTTYHQPLAATVRVVQSALSLIRLARRFQSDDRVCPMPEKSPATHLRAVRLQHRSRPRFH